MTGHLVALGQSYPVSWKLYRRQASCEATGLLFASKPELVQAVLREFTLLPDTHAYVPTDSWYPSQDLLTICQEQRGFDLISAVKTGRKVKAMDHDLWAKQSAQALLRRAFDLVTVNTTAYKGWAATGRLSSGHQVKLVLNRVIGQRGWRYLIHTDLTLTAQAIISSYLVRWEVENFYRVAKQSLGWGDYQTRDLFAIERHVQLMIVAHAYLELERQDTLAVATAPDARVTLGDIHVVISASRAEWRTLTFSTWLSVALNSIRSINV